jgi:hypothetical protein
MILKEAADSLRSIMGWPPSADLKWSVGDRVDRRHSSIFLLRAEAVQSHANVYYKIFHPPAGESEGGRRWTDYVVEGLGRTVELDKGLAELLSGKPIMISQTLAADPDTMTQVTLGVDGEAIGKIWRHSLTGGRRERIVHALALTGHAAALIERLSPQSIPLDARAMERRREKRLMRMERTLIEPTLAKLARRMEEVDAAVLDDPHPNAYAHGDLSSTNVLLRRPGIGLIDFSWAPRLRGFDMARFAFRLEYDTVTTRIWAKEMVDALLRGYGQPELVTSPRWVALRVPWLLKIVERGQESSSRRYRVRASRALAEIESML